MDEEEEDAEAWIPDTATTSETDKGAEEESRDSDPPEDPATPWWTGRRNVPDAEEERRRRIDGTLDGLLGTEVTEVRPDRAEGVQAPTGTNDEPTLRVQPGDDRGRNREETAAQNGRTGHTRVAEAMRQN